MCMYVCVRVSLNVWLLNDDSSVHFGFTYVQRTDENAKNAAKVPITVPLYFGAKLLTLVIAATV